MHKHGHIGHMIPLFIFSFLSIICIILLITDNNQPSYYNFLFLLPLSFLVFSWIFYKLYYMIPSNMGVSLIVMLYFIRNVVSPIAMYMGDYHSTIYLGVNDNTNSAILLVIYETLVVFLSLYYNSVNNFNNVINESPKYRLLSKRGKRVYAILVIIIIIIISICIRYTPQLMMSYRSITEISDPHFANMEDGYIVKKYGTTFLSKLSLVIGNYLMRIALLIVPATVIVLLFEYKKNNLTRCLTMLICFCPFFFIGGAIGRSLIYVICLVLLRDFLYHTKSMNTRIVIVASIGFIAIISYWAFRGLHSAAGSTSFSEKFSSYFSSVNIVSGVFNLPRNLENRIKYFIFDYTTTVPFGNTIFGTAGETTVQPFFNMYNNSLGQIPPTIAMGYYYFGALFAPVYSIVFSSVAFKSGEKIRCKKFDNPFQFARIMYTIFTFSMGIVMYNIEITMTNTLCILLPMFIMEKIAYDNK